MPDRLSRLFQYPPVRKHVRQAINSPAADHAHRPAGQPDQTRFDEEDSHDLAVRTADGLHDADFARPFADGHNHRVRDAERRDQQRDAPDQPQRAVDDQEDLFDLFDLIGEAPGSEAALLDLFFYSFDLRDVFDADLGVLVTGVSGEQFADARHRVAVDVAELFRLAERDEHVGLHKVVDVEAVFGLQHADDAVG